MSGYFGLPQLLGPMKTVLDSMTASPDGCIQINNKYIENHPPILGSVSIKDGIVKCVFHENGGPYNFKEQPYEEVYREVYGKERAQE